MSDITLGALLSFVPAVFLLLIRERIASRRDAERHARDIARRDLEWKRDRNHATRNELIDLYAQYMSTQMTVAKWIRASVRAAKDSAEPGDAPDVARQQFTTRAGEILEEAQTGGVILRIKDDHSETNALATRLAALSEQMVYTQPNEVAPVRAQFNEVLKSLRDIVSSRFAFRVEPDPPASSAHPEA